jgi:hypothetical protein
MIYRLYDKVAQKIENEVKMRNMAEFFKFRIS